jgi:hypothetical protein
MLPNHALHPTFQYITMATFAADCLPPKGFYESCQALYEPINSYVKLRGYAFTTPGNTTASDM